MCYPVYYSIKKSKKKRYQPRHRPRKEKKRFKILLFILDDSEIYIRDSIPRSEDDEMEEGGGRATGREGSRR